MFNVTTSRPSRRKLSGARPPVCAGLSYPDGRGRLGLPSGLHPGATPANPGVQKGLILRGFLEAVLKWRRGRDSRYSCKIIVSNQRFARTLLSPPSAIVVTVLEYLSCGLLMWVFP
jgi:hypothetical protein